jgi:high-affinity K+ transport system ATPase subunit B
MPSKDRTDVQTYDKLPRGQKQQVDLDRRAALKKAESAPKSRMGDTVVDAVRGVGRMAGRNPAGTSSARADYTAAREKAVATAKSRAEYKDLKSGPTKLFRVPEGKGMSVDEQAKLREFKVDDSARHYKGTANVTKKK